MTRRRQKPWRAERLRLCHDCGRVLEPWEVCECAGRLPKDGFRARCPAFRARASYRGSYYIVCTGKLKFPDKDARDRHYMDVCCGNCSGCRGLGGTGHEQGV